MKVLFITRNVWYSKIVHNYLLTHFKTCDVVKKKNNFTNLKKKYDLILSFGYRYIILPYVLKKSKYLE